VSGLPHFARFVVCATPFVAIDRKPANFGKPAGCTCLGCWFVLTADARVLDGGRVTDGIGMHAGLVDVGVGEVTAKASAALINGALGAKTRPVLYLAHAHAGSLEQYTTLNDRFLSLTHVDDSIQMRSCRTMPTPRAWIST